MFHDLASWFTGLFSPRKDCIEFAETFLCNFDKQLIINVEREDFDSYMMFNVTVSRKKGGREIPRGLHDFHYDLVEESGNPRSIVDQFQPKFNDAIQESSNKILIKVFLEGLNDDTLLLTVYAHDPSVVPQDGEGNGPIAFGPGVSQDGEETDEFDSDRTSIFGDSDSEDGVNDGGDNPYVSSDKTNATPQKKSNSGGDSDSDSGP